MKEFYHFPNLIHKEQPITSEWCWAACFEMVFSQFFLQSELPQRMCDFVLEYLLFTNRSIVEEKLCKTIINERTEIPPWANIPLDEELHLMSFLGKYDVEIVEYKLSKDIENDYAELSKLLQESGLPLFCKLDQGLNNSSHLRIISGYASYNECKFILCSDPIHDEEIYFPMKTIFQETEKIWWIKRANKSRFFKIEEDKQMLFEITKIETRLYDFYNSNKLDVEVNPLVFFQNNLRFLDSSFSMDFEGTVVSSKQLLKKKSSEFTCNLGPLFKRAYLNMLRPIPVNPEDLHKVLDELQKYSIKESMFLIGESLIKISQNIDDGGGEKFNFLIQQKLSETRPSNLEFNSLQTIKSYLLTN